MGAIKMEWASWYRFFSQNPTKSEQGDFVRIFEATVFLQHRFGLLTSSSLLILGPVFQECPHPRVLSNEVNIIQSHEALQEVFLVCLFGGQVISFITQISVLQKRKEIMLII
jgi:hypothetical protein